MKNNKYIYIKIIMSILKIARIGHPILTKKAEKLKNISQNALKRIIIDMTHTLIDSNGIGLAATQIGVSKRVAEIAAAKKALIHLKSDNE